VGQGIWDGLNERVSAVAGAVGGWLQPIVGAVSGLAGSVSSAASEIGQAVINGISRAISAGVGAIRDAAAGAARAALSAAKDALGISSPSKLFNEQVGRPIVQGLMQGVSDLAGPLNAQLSSLVQPPRLTGAYAGGGGFSGGGGITFAPGSIVVQGTLVGEGQLANIRSGRFG
jgi:hypothetical protein